MRRSFLVSVAIAFFGFGALFVSEFLIEWVRLGRPSLADMSWAGENNGKLVDLLSPMARAYNNVLAMLIATIGLAIPLTANMHTPTLIELFLRDRINRFVLSFMALGAGNVLFVDYIVGPRFAPTWAIALAVWSAIAGWALLIPYFFYVVRFLDPGRIIDRLRAEAVAIVDDVRAGKREPVAAQAAVAQRIDQLGTIILKSLERADRVVAREGAWALKRLLDHYGGVKDQLPPAWFAVDRADFVGLSDEALEMLSSSRTWYEMKVGHQMWHAYQQALARASDTISTLSDANRVIALGAAARGDEEALRLGIRFFNNFLRSAIRTGNVRAVYDVFHQYRRLARDMGDRPERLREIGRYFRFYAEMARGAGLLFAPQLVIFDLGYIVRRAYEQHSEAAPDLLAEALAMPHRSGDDVHSLAVKAKLILGGFFVETNRADEAARVRAELADVPAAQVRKAEADLLDAERAFFEVTDRQLNLEYVPPERREPLQRFCADVVAAA
jgi:hypothetical protein